MTTLSLDTDDKYLLDHKVNGLVLYPAAGLVWCAWNALAKARGKQLSETPVTITNMELLSATFLQRGGKEPHSIVSYSHNNLPCSRTQLWYRGHGGLHVNMSSDKILHLGYDSYQNSSH